MGKPSSTKQETPNAVYRERVRLERRKLVKQVISIYLGDTVCTIQGRSGPPIVWPIPDIVDRPLGDMLLRCVSSWVKEL